MGKSPAGRTGRRSLAYIVEPWTGFYYAVVLPEQRLELFPARGIDGPARDILAQLGRLHDRFVALKIPDVAVGPETETAARYNACLSAWRARMEVGDLAFPRLIRKL